MPSLSELTDYETPQPEFDPGLKRVVINTGEKPKEKGVVERITDKLLGLNGEERYQLWPEKVVREGLSAAGDAMTNGTLPPGLRREDFTDIPAPDMPTNDSTSLGKFLNVAPVAASPADPLIEKAQAMSALAGSGGLAGTTDATLGATPFLRPALKYKDRLYKGKEGQQHMDVIPEALYPEFQKMAMSGEDISHYNFGFVNEKGHFLDREKALEYGINNGLIDPQAGKFGALTSTLMADSSKPGTAIEAMAKADPFFSALEHNVKNINQSKMNGEAWLGTLSNKPGVKPEELDWTGLKSFLEENKGKPVTKAQIEEHLAANKVELKEVSKGELSDKDILAQSKISQEDWDKMSQSQKEVIRSNFPVDKTKYHSYQLPGGENYREMLMTLPHESKINWQTTPEGHVTNGKYTIKNEPFQDQPNYITYGEGGRRLSANDSLDHAKNLIEMAGNNEAKSNLYRSSHWDEPNILAHVRMNDRTIDGKKSLHLEEIQSDWHQQGRDKGYKGEGPKAVDLERASNIAYQNLAAKLKEAQPDLDQRAVYRLADSLVEKVREGERDSFHTKDEHALAQNFVDKEAAYLKHSEAAEQARVPDAPFKKSWHELALKRMIREAAEKGYDRLSWTPGEAQAARYDLSKQVNLVSAMKHGDKYNVYIEGKDGQALFRRGDGWSDHGQKTMTEQELKDTIGKEAAEKIINGKPNKEGWVDLRDNNLKIGGEGMKGFYDQIIPKAIEKIGKEHGVKVKSIDVPTGNYTLPEGGMITPDRMYLLSDRQKATLKPVTQKMHVIDIPASLRDTAMRKGFPLFSSTHMYIPVNHDPFEKKK